MHAVYNISIVLNEQFKKVRSSNNHYIESLSWSKLINGCLGCEVVMVHRILFYKHTSTSVRFVLILVISKFTI